jgi:N-formylmaleamate deformylase
MPRWDHHLLNLKDGKTLSYYRTGQLDAPTIVLAHGITDNALCWAPVVYKLAYDFDVVFYDAYGHGLSNPMDAGHRFDLAWDLDQLIKALQLESPTLWGHSMGAVTISHYAANFNNDASMIILEDPAWMDDLDLLPAPADMAMGIREVQHMPLAQIVSMYQRENLQWAAEESIRMALAREQFDLEFFNHDIFRDWEWRGTVKQIGCPMLLLTGDPEKGAIVTPDIAEYVVAYNDMAEHINIASAGHSIRRDKPAQYFMTINRFIQKHV